MSNHPTRDALLARSPSFQALAKAHEGMLEALRHGTADEAIAACRALADGIEPGLAVFYDRIAARAADFRPVAPS